jgi:hypothetical protein
MLAINEPSPSRGAMLSPAPVFGSSVGVTVGTVVHLLRSFVYLLESKAVSLIVTIVFVES